MPSPLELAVAAATAGAEVVRRADRSAQVRSKSAAIDLVTDADVASGVAVVREILRHDPTARLLVEEPETHRLVSVEPASLDEPEVWVIDPIDGTTSFVHGYPFYSVSVSLMREGQPVVGAVVDVPRHETYAAATGHGSFREGKRVTCTSIASVELALLATGFPYDRARFLDRQLAVLSEVLRRGAHDVRRDGSAALDCCLAASGRVDGFWEFGLKPWDMAAGVVILREAGAAVTDAEGLGWTRESTSIVAANPALHADMLAAIRAASVAGSDAAARG